MNSQAFSTISDALDFFKEHYQMAVEESTAKHISEQERAVLLLIADVWAMGYYRLKMTFDNSGKEAAEPLSLSAISSITLSVRSLQDISLKAGRIGRPGDMVLLTATTQEMKAALLIPELDLGNHLIHNSQL